MTRATAARASAALATLFVLGPLGACSDHDACKGVKETCLSLTLVGAEGVGEADQLQVLVQRKPASTMQDMALGAPLALPFKVAVLWPDGPATVSVRTSLSGQVNGVSSELTLDLRSGQHAMRRVTLYPPLLGPGLPDLGGPRDLGRPSDLRPPADLSTPADLRQPDDLSMPMPDLAEPADLSIPGPGSDL
ncbi:MAG: hypothetical protein U1A78_04305 [Polyangia bacterium]